MSGAQFFLLFLVFAWPALFAGVIELRRRLKVWLWLEGQWEERKRLLSFGRRKRKPIDDSQILLFPALAGTGPKVTDASGPKVEVWK